MEIQRNLLHSDLRTIESELLFLPKLNEILRFKELENEKDRKEIEKELLEFSRGNGKYDQIRYINTSGLEVTRVNYNEGNPTLTQTKDLQNKGERYYFKNSISIPDGQIYISPFDLNIEHGKIEQPLKPVIRFGTPIYNSNGDTRGIIMLNFLGKHLIDNLIVATKIHPGTYSLLNSDGFWLYNNNPDEEWGFMYPDKKDLRLSKTNPQLWEQLITTNRSQQMSGDYLYTAEKIYLLQKSYEFDNSNFFILFNTITAEEMKIDKKHELTKIMKIMLVSAIIHSLLSYFLMIIILQRNEYREALKESALYDRLTGLPNRTLLDERGAHIAGHAQRYNHLYSVMFMDLDGFKLVNDTFGHKTGDRLLQKIANVLKSSIRDSDTAARFGGDEFIILMEVIKDIKDCIIVAERILSKLTEEIIIDGNRIDIGMSIGIAVVSLKSKATYNDALLAADAEMYKIKKSGKNNFKIKTI